MTGSALQSGKNQDCVLHFLGDIAALEAACAHLDMHGCSAENRLYADNIRFPQTARMIIGLADLISAHHALAANFTFPGHIKPTLYTNNRSS